MTGQTRSRIDMRGSGFCIQQHEDDPIAEFDYDAKTMAITVAPQSYRPRCRRKDAHRERIAMVVPLYCIRSALPLASRQTVAFALPSTMTAGDRPSAAIASVLRPGLNPPVWLEGVQRHAVCPRWQASTARGILYSSARTIWRAATLASPGHSIRFQIARALR